MLNFTKRVLEFAEEPYPFACAARSVLRTERVARSALLAQRGKVPQQARVRTYDEHMTPTDFSLQHTKPLFQEMKLLTVHHLYFLYTLNCIRELFKIRNYSCPTSILSMLKHAHQYSGKHLKLTTPNYTMRRYRIQFLYKCTQICNS